MSRQMHLTLDEWFVIQHRRTVKASFNVIGRVEAYPESRDIGYPSSHRTRHALH